MQFEQSKKQHIMLYLLEKMKQNTPSVSKHVAEVFEISPNTVHSYIKQLLDDQIIRRVKRGHYELVTTTTNYLLTRSKGELENEDTAYTQCLAPHLTTFSSNIQKIWSYTFTEMVNNVIDHSQAETLTIRVVQDYLTTTVEIIDDGVGIFEKIRTHFQYSSLDEAICELFKGKLTTDEKNHSGEGIFFSARLMDRFYIFSSQKIFTTNIYNDESLETLPFEGLSGTSVRMELSNFSQKSPEEVFNQFSDADDGFTKTSLPLKNIFNDAPVSRSQAKRVCSRLEKFEEVILDFEGLDWMGQGFAHQLFIVFGQQHPDIHLVPIHMNDAVTKIYQHVQHNQ